MLLEDDDFEPDSTIALEKESINDVLKEYSVAEGRELNFISAFHKGPEDEELYNQVL